MAVIGVDGCRGGWLAAVLDAAGAVRWQWSRDIADVLAARADAVAVDVPIGLPEAGGRACDRDARAMLGRRGVSVFAAPVRDVLRCGTYAEARALLAERGRASMSAQAFGIVRAVAQVDAALSPADEGRVVEAHPEVAFCAMGGGRDLPAKRTTAGAALRIRLLQTWLPDVLGILAEVPDNAPLDDALDALACAWVARRWQAGSATALGDGARDRRGLVMRIVV